MSANESPDNYSEEVMTNKVDESSDSESEKPSTELINPIIEESEKLINGKNLVNGTNCLDQDSVNHNILSEEQEEKHVDLEDVETPKLKSSLLNKVQNIVNSLVTSDIQYLKAEAISEAGLVLDHVRQSVWPKLLGVDIHATSPRPTKEEIESHPYYSQVLLDVNRSLKRFPPSIKEEQRLAMQDQLILLIMRVLIKHPAFHYYQGYHDICVTFLLVLGEEMSFHVVERLSRSHLNVFLHKNMEPTVQMLNYIYPIVQKEKPILYEFLEKSDVGVIFALSWVITWFGHVLNKYSDVVRLFDFFIVTSRWMPVYLSSAIVLYREQEILQEECEIACVHSLLLQIPEDLPFEKLIIHSLELFEKYPPNSLTKTVVKRIEMKKKALVANQRPSKNSRFINYINETLKFILPNKRTAFSLAIATAVLLSAIWYQSYKTN